MDVVDELVHGLGSTPIDSATSSGRRRAAEPVGELFAARPADRAPGLGPNGSPSRGRATRRAAHRGSGSRRNGRTRCRARGRSSGRPGRGRACRPKRGRCGSRGSAPGARPPTPRTARAAGAPAPTGPRRSPARRRSASHPSASSCSLRTPRPSVVLRRMWCRPAGAFRLMHPGVENCGRGAWVSAPNVGTPVESLVRRSRPWEAGACTTPMIR